MKSFSANIKECLNIMSRDIQKDTVYHDDYFATELQILVSLSVIFMF